MPVSYIAWGGQLALGVITFIINLFLFKGILHMKLYHNSI